jgi:hypothetical protein
MLGGFGRLGSVLGSFCPYDAVCSRFRVAVHFRVYFGDDFAHADPTRPPPRSESTQNVARIPKSTLAGLRGFTHFLWHIYNTPSAVKF